MTVFSRQVLNIPEDTFHAARRIYSIQHSYLRIGDQLGKILAAVDLQSLDPSGSLSGDMALRLPMITIFQYAENLPDLAASEATLRRIDWKYALFLPVNHPGISPAELCEFRQRLYPSQPGMREFGRLLGVLQTIGLPISLPTGPEGDADPIQNARQVLSIVCKATRLHRLNLAMKMALGVLSSTRPDWLRAVVLPHWYERYKAGQLYQSPYSDLADLFIEASSIGADIYRLLSALWQPDAGELTNLPEIRSLEKLWEEQYQQGPDGFTWRMPGCGNCQA